MKKVLCSIAVALLILTLTGCADMVRPVQPEEHPLQPEVAILPESTGPVKSETVPFSASNDPVEEPPVTEEPETDPEPEVPARLPAAPPQNVPAPKRTADQEKTPDPAPILPPEPEPEPEPTPSPAPPAEPEAPAEPEPSEPAFSIDHWIGYAQEYAKSAGLNLDPTAVACWDNPITAGAHCTCLERDIQSRLNRYARDETILDVWVWAESRSDGSYDLYIGYA